MMKLLGKLNYINSEYRTYSFSVNKSQNPDKYDKLARMYKKLKKKYKNSYLPIYKKEFNGNSFFSISATLSNGLTPPKLSNLYNLNIELYATTNNKLHCKIKKISLAKDFVLPGSVLLDFDDLDVPKLTRETTSITPASSDDEASDSD